MERSKAIITLIFILNLVAFSAIGAKVSKRKYTIFDQKIEIQRDLHQSPEKKNIYRFENPEVAIKLLQLLDPIPNLKRDYSKLCSVRRDPGYCLKAHQALVKDPDFFFTNLTFMTDYHRKSLVRTDVIPAIGKEVNPIWNYRSARRKDNPISPQLNNIFTKIQITSFLQLGVHMGCITQNYNHIPGISILTRKDSVALAGQAYDEKYKFKPHCFNGDKFFPETWVLSRRSQCESWFKYINSKEYEEEKKKKVIVFIRKVSSGVHRGNGVEPVNAEEESSLRDLYKNGTACGQIRHGYLVQRYLHNPLLVYGHKFDFRVYMMIASTNPLIVYYHDGFLRVSLFKYNVESNEKGMHLTNTAQSDKVFKKKAHQERLGMNETELRNFQMWNYTRLAKYLLEHKRIDSLDWIDTYLRPSFAHAMQHLIRMTKHVYSKRPNVWELFGVDFMLDQDLNLWFIECNTGPVLKATNREKGQIMKTMLKDMFEIVNAQLRSRLKRVIGFVNDLTREGALKLSNSGTVELPNLAQKRERFRELLVNKVEKEFAVSPNNSWMKIVDESLAGPGRYNGMFSSDCFD